MRNDDLLPVLARKYQLLRAHVNEKAFRLTAAADAQGLGRGGISLVAQASGLSRTTLYAGLHELEREPGPSTGLSGRSRRAGGGRRKLTQGDPTLLRDLDRLVDPVTRGDPESPLRWTCKSTTKLAEEWRRLGHSISARTVWQLLSDLGYSMQSNRKTREGAHHPDRDAQFCFIAGKVDEFQRAGQPVISVDTKKKELIGDYKNAGQEWQKKREPVPVQIHDFVDKELGKVIPYGVYDLTHNQGWVSVGVTHDTAAFAVASIRRWWQAMGQPVYPTAKRLLITADGGSNGYRVRLWKTELQQLADELRLLIQVCHFPPGTSKWNKIEHRLFCHITENWRGRPLTSRAVVVNLISNTRTTHGLAIQAALDEAEYPTGIKISDEAMACLHIECCPFHGEWNYLIKPSPVTS